MTEEAFVAEIFQKNDSLSAAMTGRGAQMHMVVRSGAMRKHIWNSTGRCGRP